jgi:hypothetical protein
MQNKLISNREMFRQLLARDITGILDTVNAGTWIDVRYLRGVLHNSLSARHYIKLHTAQGHCYTSFNDRFYRALQSINDKGYGLTIRKDKQTNKLFVFSTRFADNYVEAIADTFDDWRTCYKSNRGYEINVAKDEAVA